MDGKRLELAGVLDLYSGSMADTGPRIGGVDVISALDERFPRRYDERPRMKVWLGVEPVADGALWAIHGFGGTDITPARMPEITVGGLNILERLDDLDGREVLLIVEARKWGES
jgi:hypothetical protein